jgi:hypothetical protein
VSDRGASPTVEGQLPVRHLLEAARVPEDWPWQGRLEESVTWRSSFPVPPAVQFRDHLFLKNLRGGAPYSSQHLKPIKSGVIRFLGADAHSTGAARCSPSLLLHRRHAIEGQPIQRLTSNGSDATEAKRTPDLGKLNFFGDDLRRIWADEWNEGGRWARLVRLAERGFQQVASRSPTLAAAIIRAAMRWRTTSSSPVSWSFFKGSVRSTPQLPRVRTPQMNA